MIINTILLICTIVMLSIIYILKIEHDVDKDMYRQRLEELYLEKQYREEAESELELLKRIESLRVESMKLYGVDISGDWDKTATSKTAALEQAYLRGRADERKRYEEIMNEDRPACCIDHGIYGLTCDICEFGLGE